MHLSTDVPFCRWKINRYAVACACRAALGEHYERSLIRMTGIAMPKARVFHTIPFSDSGETGQNSEPSLAALIRWQSQATRKNPHGQPEPLVEGRCAIIGRSETIERRGMIIQSDETLLKRLILTRRSGRVRQDGRRLGWGIEQSDLRLQACQSHVIARRP